MTKRHVLAGTLAIAAVAVGCQNNTTTHDRFSFAPKQSEQGKVTVRFVNQPGLHLASFDCPHQDVQVQQNVQSQPYVQPQQYDQPQQDVQLASYSSSSTPCNHGECKSCKARNNGTSGKPGVCKFSCPFAKLFGGKSSSNEQFANNSDCGHNCDGNGNCNHGTTNYNTSYTDNTGYTNTTGNTGYTGYTGNNSVVTTTEQSTKVCNMGGLAFGGGETSQHAVLWGNGYDGQNVTSGPLSLNPGSYTFAYFDPNRGSAYQGWLAVNSGGDDVLSALTEWRDTIHAQEEWLAFEYKINGKYSSHNPDDFNRFNSQLANLRRLESKINAAIYAEQKDRANMIKNQSQYLGDTQVVLMPGPSNGFAQPVTMPAFNPADLSTAQGGEPVTKVILAGDFNRVIQKLDRLTDLQNEMRRCRTVLSEEIGRLENRRSYYRLTAHLYNQDFDFVANEQRVAKARGMVASIDRQINQNRHHSHAVLAVVGLFAPEEANIAFEREQSEIRGERAVWLERLNQVEMQFNDASSWSEKRVSLERQRQYLIGQINECDTQLTQAEQAMETIAQLRANTGVIYRNGPASIMAASFITDSVPARLANAIEQESMLTIRLHSAEGLRPSPKHLTEGGPLNQQMFMLTGDNSNFEQPTVYENDGWDGQQQDLIDWSNTQRNYGQPGQNPSDCGPYQNDQP